MGGIALTAPVDIKGQHETKRRGTLATSGRDKNAGSIEEVAKLVDFFFPIYYSREPLTEVEKERAIISFKLISSNQAQAFYRLKQQDPVNVPCNSPMEFFGNRFYKRFIEVHPTSQALFGKSTMKQGSLLYHMMNFVVSDLEQPNPEKFQKTFEMLASSHNRIGVRAAEYGIFGEVLFWTLKLTIGKEIYDTVTHCAWIKIFSRMLSIILPIVVKYEFQNQDNLRKSGIKRMKSFITSTEEEDVSTVDSSVNKAPSIVPFDPSLIVPLSTNEVKSNQPFV